VKKMSFAKTAFLMIALTLLLMLIGGVIGGTDGMTIALIFAGVMNFFTYWFSDKIVLAMYRAQEASESSKLYRIVERLTQRAGLPMPKVYIIPTETPNAFATGRNPRHAAVAATEGALRTLSDEELAGVIGHELAHVRHRDILISTIAATMAGAIMWLASIARWAAIFGGGIGGDDDERGGGILGFLVLAIVAPIAAMLIQLAISRSREYAADEEGAKIAGNPLYLADALERLHYGVQRRPMVRANAATSHLFIVNPFRGGGIAKLFSTHPPIEERVRRLRQMTRM